MLLFIVSKLVGLHDKLLTLITRYKHDIVRVHINAFTLSNYLIENWKYSERNRWWPVFKQLKSLPCLKICLYVLKRNQRTKKIQGTPIFKLSRVGGWTLVPYWCNKGHRSNRPIMDHGEVRWASSLLWGEYLLCNIYSILISCSG